MRIVILLLFLPLGLFAQDTIMPSGYNGLIIGETFSKENITSKYKKRNEIYIHSLEGFFIERFVIFECENITVFTYKDGMFSQKVIDKLVFKYPGNFVTNTGIKIGESTKKDVIQIYGEPKGLSQNSFYYSVYPKTQPNITFVFGAENDEYVKKDSTLLGKVVEIILN